ncbi:MAG: CsbD family protein [Sulfuricaulis sp.]
MEGNWKQFKGKVKEQWGRLMDDQLDTIAGRREQRAGKIQKSYGIGRDGIKRHAM